MTTTLQVSGMSCNHCVRAVTEAINALDPQASVTVDLASGRVTIEDTLHDDAALAAAIEEEGYQVAA